MFLWTSERLFSGFVLSPNLLSPDREEKTFSFVLYLILGMVWFFFSLVATGVFWNYSARRAAANLAVLKEKGAALLNDRGISLSSSCAKIQLSWECATEWGKYGEFIYVMCGNFILLIDRNRITEQEYAVLQNLLEEYVSLS